MPSHTTSVLLCSQYCVRGHRVLADEAAGGWREPPITLPLLPLHPWSHWALSGDEERGCGCGRASQQSCGMCRREQWRDLKAAAAAADSGAGPASQGAVHWAAGHGRLEVTVCMCVCVCVCVFASHHACVMPRDQCPCLSSSCSSIFCLQLSKPVRRHSPKALQTK